MKEIHEYRNFMAREELHKSLNALIGLLEGVSSDGIITLDEVAEIQNWHDLHRSLIGRHPFNEISPAIDKALEDGVIDMEELQDILWLCKRLTDSEQADLYFDLSTSKIQELEGILHGMLSDGILSDSEIAILNEWLNDNDFLCGTYPFDEIYSLLLAAKEDGSISNDERNMLKAFFSSFVDTRESYNIHAADLDELKSQYHIQGLCAICPEISFDGKTFCFTGQSQRATRNEIAEIIKNKGAVFINGVSKKIDYLVVGGDGNPCWAYSCYGRKVEQAMMLRRNGHKIVIVHENDFWDEVL